MSQFTDKLGRSWQLDVNVAAMRRAKKQDIDLSMPIAQIQQYVMDDVFLTDALWSIVQPTANGLTLEQFEGGMDGQVLAEAREALWQALEAYFDPKKAEMLRAALESIKAEMANALKTLTISNGSTDAKAS